MNKYDRRNIEDVAKNLNVQADELDRLSESEREKYDNLPEGLQIAERGWALERAADVLDEQANAIRDVITEIQEL